jgi:hypothetical protein
MRLPLTPIIFVLITVAVLARAQSMPSAPNFANGMEQLFGSNNNFTATAQLTVGSMSLTGSFFANGNNTRIDISTDNIKGLPLAMSVLTQMQESGMDHYSAVSLPSQGIDMLVFPGLNGYIVSHNPTPSFSSTNMQIAVQSLGSTTINNHACSIESVQMTNSRGQTHTFTVWYATDFNLFPIQISTTPPGENGITLNFADITVGNANDSEFGFPAGYKKFESPTQVLMEMLATKPADVPVPSDGIIR